MEVLRRSAELDFLGGMPLSDQIDHALGFVAMVEGLLGRSPESFLDLGTGGGVPGLVLVSCWPGARAVLLDANERRTEFLAGELETVADLPSAGVVPGRAEELGRRPELREVSEVVTVRSFGSPAVTAECASPLLRVGGVLVVSEPPDSNGADRWPTEGLRTVGLEVDGAFRFDDRFGYQSLRKADAVSDRFPRRVGIPTKRPLF
jgi:16S rRNA (guanine527-N7)-methyltransferase